MTPWWTAASATACRAWTASADGLGDPPGHASLLPDERADASPRRAPPWRAPPGRARPRPPGPRPPTTRLRPRRSPPPMDPTAPWHSPSACRWRRWPPSGHLVPLRRVDAPSISPLGERARASRWWLTTAAYLIGSLAGGSRSAGSPALVRGARALARSAVGAQLVAALLAVGLVLDLRSGGHALPSWRRQVDEQWLTRYRGWVYGVGFGAQLGFGWSPSSRLHDVCRRAAGGARGRRRRDCSSARCSGWCGPCPAARPGPRPRAAAPGLHPVENWANPADVLARWRGGRRRGSDGRSTGELMIDGEIRAQRQRAERLAARDRATGSSLSAPPEGVARRGLGATERRAQR